MKRALLSMIAALTVATTMAQEPTNGTTYFLPKTALRVTLLIEKTSYTPGEFAQYAGRYMKKTDVSLTPTQTYRIINTNITPIGVPDSTKRFTLNMDKKFSITRAERDESGVLLAINTAGRRTQLPKEFKAAPKAPTLNPNEFMTEEILTAGSKAKMAELCAKEIYDVRENRNLLSRGQAEFMPNDGDQMRLMMQSLNTQERALMQLFEGVTVRDTTETVVTYIPTKEVSDDLLFRFSKSFGFTDNDDLSGEPYYISIVDLKTATGTGDEAGKKVKDDVGLHVNLPGKIKATISKDGNDIKSCETFAAQFGNTETMSGDLFGKKQSCSIVLNPVTGGIEKIESKELD